MWFAAYFLVGIAVFLALRCIFRKVHLDVRPHDKIWAFCLYSVDGWILGVVCWPLLAVVSMFWLAADLLHARGRKEIARAEELESKRDKRYDDLDLMQKLERLKQEVEKRK
jgi:hypothetical protein